LSNAVRNIVQDPYGFIWLGTDNGLCRYDGTQVQPYRIAQLGISQYVSALLTTDDAVYVGTEKGVFRLAQTVQQFKQLPMDINSVVTSLAIDKEGNLWAATMEDGVWRYVVKTGQAKQYQLNKSYNGAAQVFIDNANQVWTTTNWGKPFVQRLNRLHDRFEPVELTYSQDYGTYHNPYKGESQWGKDWGTVKETPLRQVSGAFMGEVPGLLKGLTLTYGLYADRGELLPDTFGATFGLRYSL